MNNHLTDTREYKKRYSTLSTEELLHLKYRGGLVKNAEIALDSVLSDRNVSQEQIMDAKSAVHQELKSLQHKKEALEQRIVRQSRFFDFIHKWFF